MFKSMFSISVRLDGFNTLLQVMVLFSYKKCGQLMQSLMRRLVVFRLRAKASVTNKEYLSFL
jgi:hypothetical protein